MKENRYTIKIPKLKLFGYHGCYDEEKENGQEFEIEMKISIAQKNMLDYVNFDTGHAHLEDTIDYVELEKEIINVFKNDRFDLIEGLAARISAIPYDLSGTKSRLNKDIKSVSVKIRKNNPIGMSVPYVEVEYVNYYEAYLNE